MCILNNYKIYISHLKFYSAGRFKENIFKIPNVINIKNNLNNYNKIKNLPEEYTNIKIKNLL